MSEGLDGVEDAFSAEIFVTINRSEGVDGPGQRLGVGGDKGSFRHGAPGFLPPGVLVSGIEIAVILGFGQINIHRNLPVLIIYGKF